MRHPEFAEEQSSQFSSAHVDTQHSNRARAPLQSTGVEVDGAQPVLQEDDYSDEDLQQHLRWSKLEHEALNEFTTEGLLAMTFPTLFPTGAGDVVDLGRARVELRILTTQRFL